MLQAQPSKKGLAPLIAGSGMKPLRQAVGSIKIVALRVDFPQEGADSGLTTGNGQFDLSTRFRLEDRDTVIDPPPHDSLYFIAHSLFVRDYFKKVSNNKLNVEFDLLPGVVRMSKQMKFYSPTRFDKKNVPLAEMVREAWQRADSLGLLASYANADTATTMFMIFHAGAGRDIDLQSQFGFDPTPKDLPSIYFSESALRDALGEDFAGVAVAGGALHIANTAVLPESETRTIPNPQNSQQTLVIQLGMNGLFASQIGSFLGLPDLFNTKTGRTAVGRIALMDGEGIFGYGGLFPPEPMAWEKIRLGWVKPIEVTKDQVLSIYTSVYASDSNKVDSTIYKIPISADEYYLLEVRRRDAHADGGRFSTYQATQGLDRPFNYILDPRQESRPDSIAGVLISADEYDWAMFADRNRGGIAVWHVDESIIRAKEKADEINADFDHRGIRLIEADAIPDIGFTYSNPLGEFTESGRQNDLWFFNNPDRQKNDPKHVNELANESTPATRSNTGAPTFIKLTNFSAPNNLMTVNFSRSSGSQEVQLLSGFPQPVGSVGNGLLNGIVSKEESAYLFAVAGAGNQTHISGWKSTNGSEWQSAAITSTLLDSTAYHISELAIQESNTDLLLYTTEDSANNYRIAVRHFNKETGAVVLANSAALPNSTTALLVSGDTVVVGSKAGLELYSSDLSTKYSTLSSVGAVSAVAVLGNGRFAVAADSSATSESVVSINERAERVAVGVLQPATQEQGIASAGVTRSCVFNLEPKSVFCYPSSSATIALGDLNKDGVDEAILVNNNLLAAYNFSGAPVSNIYLNTPNTTFTSNPIIVDVKGEGVDVLFVADGKLQGINGVSGKSLEGFPVASGTVRKLVTLKQGNNLSVFGLADTATVIGWSMQAGALGALWGSDKADAQLTSHAKRVGGSVTNAEFFPNKRAYVWPNPVEDGNAAHLRMFVSEDAAADCLIVNDAGEQVASLKADLIGGTDNEILWDTKSLHNGVYTCRLKVESKKSGQSGSKLIKIAVVK